MKEYLEPCRHCGGKATINESCEGIDDLCEIWIISCDDCPAEMRGVRDIPSKPVKKGDTCIESSTGMVVEFTDEQIQYLNDNRFGKDEKEALIKAWNKRV